MKTTPSKSAAKVDRLAAEVNQRILVGKCAVPPHSGRSTKFSKATLRAIKAWCKDFVKAIKAESSDAQLIIPNPTRREIKMWAAVPYVDVAWVMGSLVIKWKKLSQKDTGICDKPRHRA